jgi:hypothetical protein
MSAIRRKVGKVAQGATRPRERGDGGRAALCPPYGAA